MSNMAKLAIIVTGIIVLLNFGGIRTNSGELITSLMNPNTGLSDFANSDLWETLLLVFVGSAATIVIGSFGRSPDINLLLGTVVSIFAGIVLTDMLSIYGIFWTLGGQGNNEWIRYLAGAIFIPLVFGFFVTVINFWRGNDN